MRIIRHNPWLRALSIAALLISLLLMTGCQGCRNLDEDEIAKKKEEEKKKKKKPPFETHIPIVLPGYFPNPKDANDEEQEDDDDPAAAAMAKLANSVIRYNRAKLGHWVTANFPVIANNFNADGQLSAYSINSFGQPVGIPSTNYFVATNRPASLPKGEWKNLETTVFLPRRDSQVAIANINYALERSTGGLTQISTAQPTTLMKPFQYHIVLLSELPESYNFLKLTDSIHLRGLQMGNAEMMPPFYYVIPTMPDQPVPLPSSALNWTTIAYMIWDDFDPDNLTPEHQESLLDWLHFGGQLILSGPDCLDKLQNSFLGSYLPARFDGSRNLTNADLVELNKNWTVPVAKNAAENPAFEISDRVPLLGVSFLPHEDARYVDGTGEIAIERRIGRGRIVATAFPLDAPAVRKWRSFPSFLNCALLRRPPRVFGKTEMSDVVFGWANDLTSIFDPLMGTTLRFLSRDMSEAGTPERPSYSMEQEMVHSMVAPRVYSFDGKARGEFDIVRDDNALPLRDKEDYLHFGGYADAPQSGPGGWNDDSGVSIAARETLKEAAGISPPSSDFVLKMLAAYLIVLVPLNWLIFRMLGRVEWAWISAPFIAIVGAILVVKMASLDIGFVRSNTQIGLLEIHADYPRGHTTEYSALYTSLSTRYNVDLDNGTAQSLPFARVNADQFYQDVETLSRVNLRRTLQNRLEGFQIQSNFTGMLHTEFILDLEGTITCGFDEQDQPEIVSNGSFLNLENCGVVYRDPDGNFQVAWVGKLLTATSTPDLEFEATTAKNFGDRWRRIPTFASSLRSADEIWTKYFEKSTDKVNLNQLSEIAELSTDWPTYQSLFAQLGKQEFNRSDFRQVYQSYNNKSDVRVGRLFDVIASHLQLAPGECRLIGTTTQRLGRTRFDPEATQTDQQTLVLVHLRQPELPIARRDVNSQTEFSVRSDLDWQSEIEAFDSGTEE